MLNIFIFPWNQLQYFFDTYFHFSVKSIAVLHLLHSFHFYVNSTLYRVRHWFFPIATTKNITTDREKSMADRVELKQIGNFRHGRFSAESRPRSGRFETTAVEVGAVDFWRPTANTTSIDFTKYFQVRLQIRFYSYLASYMPGIFTKIWINPEQSSKDTVKYFV